MTERKAQLYKLIGCLLIVGAMLADRFVVVFPKFLMLTIACISAVLLATGIVWLKIQEVKAEAASLQK